MRWARSSSSIGAKIFYRKIFSEFDPLIVLGVTGKLIAAGVITSLTKTASDEELNPETVVGRNDDNGS